MDDATLKTLKLAIDRGWLSLAGKPVAFFNAAPVPGLPPDWREGFACEQGFRPTFVELERQGYRAVPRLEVNGDRFAGAAIVAGRLRLGNELMLARAWAMVPQGAPILVAGANTDGIRSLRKWASRFAPVEHSLSKHHAVAFVVRRGGGNPFPVKLTDPAEPVSPAMFSASGEDAGSQMLAGHFDARISGAVADFGAGTGYLARQLLETGKAERLDLYEADFVSLERAKIALSGFAAGAEIGFLWHDLLGEKVPGTYDWVVMNPPFHAGRAARPEIGTGFIEVAARALGPGGRLLMVANRNLPYETVLARHFGRVEKLEEDRAYKVFRARR